MSQAGPTATFAILTDIHGNATALEAVLHDIELMRSRRCSDTFERVCLGDSFDGGPEPLAVLRSLAELGCAHLRGNHEDYLFQYKHNPDSEKFKHPLWKFIPWTVEQLGAELDKFRVKMTDHWASEQWNLAGVHASRSNNARVPDFFTQQSLLSAEFIETHEVTSPEKVFFNGHSHYLGQHRNTSQPEIWFNCGSVGYPFVSKVPEFLDAPVATWVWVECALVDGVRRINVVNRRVPYSSDRLLQRYVESGALELCAPFSFAILAQSLFNTDVVYPFFQSVKRYNPSPTDMANMLLGELERQSVFERINSLLRRAGLREVRTWA
jgi:hypothetical protein